MLAADSWFWSQLFAHWRHRTAYSVSPIWQDGYMNDRGPADATIITRVRKLLATAEGSSFPDEADLFARKAALLIAEYRITPEALAEGAPTEQLGVSNVHVGRGAYARGRLALLQAIAEGYDCKVVFEHAERGIVAFVAGFAADRKITEVLYQSLHSQAAARMAAIRRATAAATQKYRRAFLLGYAHEVATMIGQTSHEAAQQHAATGGTALAVVERSERASSYAANKFGRVRRARPIAPVVAGGVDAGRRAARSADLGRTRIDTRRAISH